MLACFRQFDGIDVFKNFPDQVIGADPDRAAIVRPEPHETARNLAEGRQVDRRPGIESLEPDPVRARLRADDRLDRPCAAVRAAEP